MGCKFCKTEAYEQQDNDGKRKRRRRSKRRRKHGKHRRQRHHSPQLDVVEIDKLSRDGSSISQDEIDIDVHTNNDTVSEHSLIFDEFVNIEVDDPEAFNQPFIQQRQQAINNTSYRLTIELWQPNSLQQLAQFIKDLSKGKSIVDRHWIIFYWIAVNIKYDTLSSFAKDNEEQSAEAVFRTKKGVCTDYASLYKYLCDQLQMPCEVVDGHSKGYGFDDREGAPGETDHAWNAVEIYHHWYLIESTWGAGHLDDTKQFKYQLASYYFLPRPDQMIYHHLPKDDNWQLLQTPIKMEQYLQLPKLRPEYFQFNLETIQPQNQCFVNLEQDKPFALVIIKAPTDVHIIADLKLDDQKVEGGHDVIFDRKKRHYYCYFAPTDVGKHKITIYAKRGDAVNDKFSAVLDLIMNIKQMPDNPISYPRTWKCFFDFGLKILSPLRTHLINLDGDEKFTQILIRAPSDIELMGRLKNRNEEIILCGDRVYYDREKDFWRCEFAPNTNGIFDALILAKRKVDHGSYLSAISLKINANQIPSSPFSFPTTWQIFYDLGLQLVSPVGRGIIELNDKILFVEIRIKAPDDVALIGELRNNKDEEITGGEQIYYDKEKDFWRCKFAPNRNGTFDAYILAKKKSNSGGFTSAVSFKIKVKQAASQPLSLLNTTQLFYDYNLKVLSPIGRSKINLPEKSLFAEICLKTPSDIDLLGQMVDSNQEIIPNAEEVYYDRHKDIWRCKFAPNQNGLFDARIMAKKKTDSGLYLTAVTFQIESSHVPSPPLTFPKTWQSFYDFDLKLESPLSRSTAVWSDKRSYAEILIRASDDIQLSSRIEYQNTQIQNGTLVQYDHEKQLWQLLFAPQQTGLHDLLIFGKRINDKTARNTSVVLFPLNVTRLKHPMKFPTIYPQFKTTKCRIHTPLTGTLKNGSVVPIRCVIPGAKSVTLTIDSKTVRSKGYVDPILERQITVGSEEVTICAKYGQSPHYTILVKYSVE